MTSCRWANFFVFFFYDLRKLFSFSSLRPEETFLYCFFKIWGNVFRPFLKKNMTVDLRHTALDCSLLMHWLDIPFPHLFLSFSLCLDGASFQIDKALPPEKCCDPLKIKESGTQVCHACDLVKTFGEEEKLGNCCLVMDCLFLWVCQCQGQGNYGGAPR